MIVTDGFKYSIIASILLNSMIVPNMKTENFHFEFKTCVSMCCSF